MAKILDLLRGGKAAPAIVVHIRHDHDDPLISQLLQKVNLIMATQAQLAADLAAIGAQVTKIGTETAGLQQRITELEAAIETAGGTTPEVDAALAAVKTQVQVVDDLVTDAPTPTP